MSRQVPSSKVFDAVAVSSTNTVYSGTANPNSGGNATGSDVPNGRTASFVGSFTSTPNGTLTVEVSNSKTEDIRLGLDTWITYDQVNGSGFTAGVATVTSGQINGSASFGISLTKLAFRRVRLKYTNSSGSGTISATITLKAD